MCKSVVQTQPPSEQPHTTTLTRPRPLPLPPPTSGFAAARKITRDRRQWQMHTTPQHTHMLIKLAFIHYTLAAR